MWRKDMTHIQTYFYILNAKNTHFIYNPITFLVVLIPKPQKVYYDEDYDILGCDAV
jgi:hypothetical protein